MPGRAVSATGWCFRSGITLISLTFSPIISGWWAKPRHFPDFIGANGTAGIPSASRRAAHYHMEVLKQSLVVLCVHVFIYLFICLSSQIKFTFHHHGSSPLWGLFAVNSQSWVDGSVLRSHHADPSPLVVRLVSLPPSLLPDWSCKVRVQG